MMTIVELDYRNPSLYCPKHDTFVGYDIEFICPYCALGITDEKWKEIQRDQRIMRIARRVNRFFDRGL